MKFRNTYPAFDGEFKIEDTTENRIRLTWVRDIYQATADIDLKSYANRVSYYNETKKKITDISF
jgi:sucrose phosphorylase